MKKKNPVIKFVDGKPLEPTSSLNDHYICVCGRKYIIKNSLIKHLKTCLHKPVICHWCKAEFTNRGNLVTHAFYLHGDKDIKQQQLLLKEQQQYKKKEFKCDVCNMTYTKRAKLRFHIRQEHFNLWARIPNADNMRINEVWYEQVLNTNLIVEIKKTGINTLTMKPIPPRADIQIHECNEPIDLRSMYPTSQKRVEDICPICLKILGKQDIRKHLNEQHFNLQKHKCNNCNKTFKRSYVYLQHVCHAGKINRYKKTRVPNVCRQSSATNIKISSVESLEPVVVE